MQLPERWYPLRYHARQQALWRDPNRFKVVVAGRGSGKTEISKRFLIRMLPVRKTHGQNPLYGYLAPVREQAKRVAWSDFKKLIPPEWVAKDGISEGALVIKTVFGAELHVCGMDKPQRIEGNQWDGFVVDECSDIKPGTFTRSIRPALTHRNGFCWQIGVPKRYGVGAREFKRRYDKGLRGEGGVAAYTWPSWDILPESEVQALREGLTEKDYNEQIGASWESASGLTFYSFNDQNISKEARYNPFAPVYVCCDFNVDPMCWVLCHRARDNEQFHAFDEVVVRNTNTEECLNVLWKRYSEHKGTWTFVGDASSRARKTSASSSDYIQIKNDERFNASVRFPKSNPAIRSRLAATNALLCNAKGERRLLVHPQCTNLVEDLRNRANNPDGTPNDKDPDAGHITDAVGYGVWQYFPLRVLSQDTSEEISIVSTAY